MIVDMKALTQYITTRVVKEFANGNKECHHSVCCNAADAFDLWDTDREGKNQFPVWLSRIVAGDMQDQNEYVSPWRDEDPERWDGQS